MLINCINCLSDTNLPDIKENEKSTLNCEVCGSPVAGFKYEYCENCDFITINYDGYCYKCGIHIESIKEEKLNNNFDYLDSIDFVFIQDYEGMVDSVKKIKDSGYKELAVDTETTGLDPYTSELLLVQISTPEICYIYDATKIKDFDPVKELLESNDYLKLLQNAKFDFKVMKVHLKIEMTNVFDTMLAERTLTAGISRDIGLKQITAKYLNRYMDKSIRTSFVNLEHLEFTRAQLKYAAEDVIVLHPIYEMQKVELEKNDLMEIAELEFRTLIAVGDMELNGIKLDIDKWKLLIANADSNKKKAEKKLMAFLMEDHPEKQGSLFDNMYSINLNSSVQLLEALNKIKGLEQLKDTSGPTLQLYKENEVIQALLEYRKYEKLLTSFGEGMLKLVNPVTGRIHPDFNQFGADTGRFSCKDPNVQQIPSSQDFRECFIADKGHKLITADYSQAELRILAQLSEDPKFVGAFCSGGDLHKLTASQMFGIPVEDITKKQRSAAKTINFGLAYGRGSASLGGQLGVGPEEAKELIDQYFNAYSGVKNWLEKAGKDSFEKGYSLTPSGRKRFFEKPRHNDKDYSSKKAAIERQGKNTPIQGANADITKYALCFLYESLKPYGAKLVNTVHDEITVEAKEEYSKEIQQLLEDEMKRAGAMVVKLVPMKVDGEIADYWTK